MDGKSVDIAHQKLEQLKQVLPEAFSEGKLDLEKLRLAIGEDIAIQNERYVLNWAGKGDAFRALQTPTTATLAPAREESVNFDETENIFIEGENLEVLKVLQKAYYGKVKMIYIDPPYNTGSDSFVYPDKFSESREEYLKRIEAKDEEGFVLKEGQFRENSKDSGHYHSNWLSMMYPRLFLARNLLREDGVIFVSIDDNEVHNLRLLMNDIFGEENFVDSIIWKKRYGGGAKEKYLVSVHEYILFYAKDKSRVDNIFIPLDEDSINRYYKKQDSNYSVRGPYRTHPLEATKSVEERKNLVFPIPGPDGKDIYPKRQWWWDKERVFDALEKGELEFLQSADGTYNVHTKQYLKDENGVMRKTKPFSLIDDVYTQHGAREIADLFGDSKVFTFSKPSELLYKLLEIANISQNDMVLDFFAGSASLAQATFDYNKASNIKSNFLLVQLPVINEDDTFSTIAEIGKERIRKVIQRDNADNPLFAEQNQDLGFKVFKLKQSNFKLWRGDGITDGEQLEAQMALLADPVREDAQEENLLTELLLKSGFELTTPVEKKTVGDAHYWLAKDEEGNALAVALQAIDETLLADMIAQGPQQVICLDRLFASDQTKTNIQLQCKDAGIVFYSI